MLGRACGQNGALNGVLIRKTASKPSLAGGRERSPGSSGGKYPAER